MKCQSPTERFNDAHLKRVVEAKRAFEDRRTSEAIREGRQLSAPRKHRILNP